MSDDIIVRLSQPTDYDPWLNLAQEVEPLFGPMVSDENFCRGLRQAFADKTALSAWSKTADGEEFFQGGIVISPEANEILWLAVRAQCRGRGTGKALLTAALALLDHHRPITVTTFDQTVEAGIPARRLYQNLGFTDAFSGGQNPAFIPTVVMTLSF